jgi:membrane fusion protein (multidrug efflux system)
MKLKITIAIVFVLLVVGGLAGVKTLQIKKMIDNGKAGGGPPPESVSTVQATPQKWENTLSAIGSVRAAQGVKISAEIPGAVQELRIESGSQVEKDAILVQLDTSTEKAQLRAVEAQLELAKINLTRAEKLRAENTVSASELDSAKATLEQTQANADAIRATIEKKTIRAPFAGVVGLRQVDLGQYVEAGHMLVSLQALKPVYVDFSVPQKDLARLQTGMTVVLTTDAYPEKKFSGTLTAINPDLDPITRSVPLRGTFENSEKFLRPGMFAKVEVILPEQEAVVAIPSTSVLSAPYGDSVFIVEPSTNKTSKAQYQVRQQFIRTGRTRGDFVAVQSGLKGGEKIVNAGLFKLRNGMGVVENQTIVPEASTTPRPSDG